MALETVTKLTLKCDIDWCDSIITKEVHYDPGAAKKEFVADAKKKGWQRIQTMHYYQDATEEYTLCPEVWWVCPNCYMRRCIAVHNYLCRNHIEGVPSKKLRWL